MNFDATEDQVSIRNAIQEICNDFSDDYWLRKDREGGFPEDFYSAIAKAGWLGIAMPVEYGGAGLGISEACAMMETVSASGAGMSGASSIHMNVFGLHPVVMHGSDEQKKRWLPPIISGEAKACFGVTEPNTGLNTLKLKTMAVRKGDKYVVNGQKIWTSFANLSDWCFCLVRTDTSVKQQGISFLLIDMRSPGVEARPIKLINGISHFCETFFTDVRVPKENLLGAVNQGWTIAKCLLQHERSGLSAQRASAPTTQDLAALARTYVGTGADGRLADGDLRSRLIDHLMTDRAYRLTLTRRIAEEEAGQIATTPLSAVKNIGAQVAQQRSELTIEILGNHSLGWDGQGYTDQELHFTSEWLHSKCFSIYGGSHEIQNNITAKRVLNLPGD